MSNNRPWWFDLSAEEIEMEIDEEARQDRLAEAIYQDLLNHPNNWVGRSDKF